MMSASKFKSKSNIFLHRRHNPIIKDIDKLLKEYGKSKSENRKMKCLVYIYMMCKEYFHTKPQGKRGDAVQELMDQVKTVLDSPDFKKEITAKAGGRHYSSGQKQDLMSHTGKSSTSLSGGYTFEGILPQKNFIEKMHLNLNSLLGSDQYYGVSAMHYHLDLEYQKKNPQTAQDEALRTLKTAPLSQLLDHLHNMWHSKDMTDAGMNSFNYLSSNNRLKYLIKFENSNLCYYSTNAKADCGDFGYMYPYVIDTSERFYILNENRIGISYNHSSILSGAPVICAGEVLVKQGVLKHIDNNSGHYKPGTDNLNDAVRLLQKSYHISLNTFKVQDMKTGKQYDTAQNFISHGGRGGGPLLQ